MASSLRNMLRLSASGGRSMAGLGQRAFRTTSVTGLKLQPEANVQVGFSLAAIKRYLIAQLGAQTYTAHGLFAACLGMRYGS